MQKKIPITDLSLHYQTVKNEIEKALLEVLNSGQYILGKNVKAFEEELAKYLSCEYVVSCANGTDAIVLALMTLGIGQGDEVITVPNSFFATSEAIALVGATPVFVDIQESDFNIDPSKIESQITKKTKAIIPVHLYGQPCEIEKVTEIAKKHNLFVIEDCAQSLGAKYNGKLTGTFGTIGTFSFFPTKNLGAFGDAGAICTYDKEIAEKIKQLRVHGQPSRDVHDYVGMNSRLDEIQAAILRVNLKYLDKWNKMRQAAAQNYNELLADITQIKIPHVKPNCTHIFHQYTIRLKERDHLHNELNKANINSFIYYSKLIHKQKAFSHLKQYSLPVAERLCSEILSLPMYPEIVKEDQEYVGGKIREILRSVTVPLKT